MEMPTISDRVEACVAALRNHTSWQRLCSTRKRAYSRFASSGSHRIKFPRCSNSAMNYPSLWWAKCSEDSSSWAS